MLPDLDRLIKLQHLETLIADANGRIASHPQRLADVEARLQDAQRVVDDAKAKVEANKDARRALDKDVALYQGRLSKFKDQLASVKTNREYHGDAARDRRRQRATSAASRRRCSSGWWRPTASPPN